MSTLEPIDDHSVRVWIYVEVIKSQYAEVSHAITCCFPLCHMTKPCSFRQYAFSFRFCIRQQSRFILLHSGLIAVPGGTIGVVIPSIIINRMKLRTPEILKMCIICCLAVLCSVPVCLLYCPTAAVAGTTVPYPLVLFYTNGALYALKM